MSIMFFKEISTDLNLRFRSRVQKVFSKSDSLMLYQLSSNPTFTIEAFLEQYDAYKAAFDISVIHAIGLALVDTIQEVASNTATSTVGTKADRVPKNIRSIAANILFTYYSQGDVLMLYRNLSGTLIEYAINKSLTMETILNITYQLSKHITEEINRQSFDSPEGLYPSNLMSRFYVSIYIGLASHYAEFDSDERNAHIDSLIARANKIGIIEDKKTQKELINELRQAVAHIMAHFLVTEASHKKLNSDFCIYAFSDPFTNCINRMRGKAETGCDNTINVMSFEVLDDPEELSFQVQFFRGDGEYLKPFNLSLRDILEVYCHFEKNDVDVGTAMRIYEETRKMEESIFQLLFP